MTTPCLSPSTSDTRHRRDSIGSNLFLRSLLLIVVSSDSGSVVISSLAFFNMPLFLHFIDGVMWSMLPISARWLNDFYVMSQRRLILAAVDCLCCCYLRIDWQPKTFAVLTGTNQNCRVQLAPECLPEQQPDLLR